ncbi:hypothetical protein [Zoogloea sp. LCSB751]|uniref:hypothetical protein n=1 Tax=Zoogloea sp. LCSB751 TaxID=1965277 RepID=UPI001117910F|nr:hypothetical protein [Zoogloea sp. LCSB751]
MLSITDLLDFIDVDWETVQIIGEATGLPDDQAHGLAKELLKTQQGLYLIHQMFKDQLSAADARLDFLRRRHLHRAYLYFSRKYPLTETF